MHPLIMRDFISRENEEQSPNMGTGTSLMEARVPDPESLGFIRPADVGTE